MTEIIINTILLIVNLYFGLQKNKYSKLNIYVAGFISAVIFYQLINY